MKTTGNKAQTIVVVDVVSIVVAFVVKIWIVGFFAQPAGYKIHQKPHNVNNIVTLHAFCRVKDMKKMAVKAYFLVDTTSFEALSSFNMFQLSAKEAAALQPSTEVKRICVLTYYFFSNKSHLSWAHLTLQICWVKCETMFHFMHRKMSSRCDCPPDHCVSIKSNRVTVFCSLFHYAFRFRNC